MYYPNKYTIILTIEYCRAYYMLYNHIYSCVGTLEFLIDNKLKEKNTVDLIL